MIGNQNIKGFKSNYNPQNLVFQKEKKRKKRTTKMFFYLDRKRKKRKSPSRVNKWVKELIEKGYTKPDEIQSYFNENNILLNASDRKLYELLVRSKVDNGNISLHDTLANKPLSLYYYIPGLKTKVITNDDLYLHVLFYRKIYMGCDEFIKKLLDTSKIDNVRICSVPFNCEGKVKKGFYQDYSGKFAAIGFQLLSENEKQIMLNSKDNDNNGITFKYKGEDFFAYGNNNTCLIYTKTDSKKVKELYDNMKIIYVSNKVALTEKTFDYSKSVKFVACKVKPEEFCPMFLILPEEVVFSMLYKIDVDYNTLFDVIENEYKKSKKIAIPYNIVYWNNVNEYMDFLSIFVITSKALTKQDKDALIELCDFYRDSRDIVSAWKKIQMDLEKIYKDFYKFFVSKLDYDKLDNLYNRVVEYLDAREILMNDSSYETVLAWVKSLKYATFIQRQFDTNVMDVPISLRDVLADLHKGYKDDKLEERLREVGISIYHLTDNDDDGTIACFPFIVSPGSFLGSIEGKKIVENIVQQINQNIQNNNDQWGEESDKIYQILQNIGSYRRDAVMKLAVEYAKNNIKDREVDTKVLNDLADVLINKLDKDKDLLGFIDKQIVDCVVRDGNINGVQVSSRDFENWIKEYFLQLQEKEINEQRRINNLNSQMNNIQQQMMNVGNGPFLPSSQQSTEMSSGNQINRVVTYMDAKNMSVAKANSINSSQNKTMPEWYATIVGYSGVYNVKPDNVGELSKRSVKDLIVQYPLNDYVIDYIARMYNMPSQQDMANGYNYKYKPMNLVPINYKDPKLAKEIFVNIDSLKERIPLYG